MTDMPDEYRQQLATLVRDCGILGTLCALGDICGAWSREFDPSPATRAYAVAEAKLYALADDLAKLDAH